MLISLIAWIYISLICWIWGQSAIKTLNFLYSKENSAGLHEGIVCLVGLSLLTVVGSYLSLFLPLSSLTLDIILFLASAALAVFYIPRSFFTQLVKRGLTVPALCLFLISVALISVMSTWFIDHPDTLGYHRQIIDSINQKGIVIGYANQNLRYGFQSNWFVACSLFGFASSHISALTFVNGAICIWFIYFILTTAQNVCLTQDNKLPNFSILWLCLLLFAFWDYTQIRLTVTSASPDFVVAIFICAIFYLYFQFDSLKQVTFILVLLCSLALTIKSSSFVLGLLLTFLFFKSLRRRFYFTAHLLALTILVAAPFLIRNYLTSGFVFYPLNFPDIFSPMWKIRTQDTKDMQHYITAYARVRGLANVPNSNTLLDMPLRKWLPIWWHYNSVVQKIILLATIVVPTYCIILFKRNRNWISKRFLIVAGLTAIGIMGWFFLAPDLRFGIGYFIVFLGVLLSHVIATHRISVGSKTFSIFCYLISITLLVYTIYRFVNFFSAQQLIFPLGIVDITV